MPIKVFYRPGVRLAERDKDVRRSTNLLGFILRSRFKVLSTYSASFVSSNILANQSAAESLSHEAGPQVPM